MRSIKRGTLIAQILIALLGTMNSVAVARPSVVQEVSEATQITAEERREVLKVAERFVRRMQETNDLAPLIGEMFVADYAERLHQESLSAPLMLMSKGAAEQASSADIMRYHLALNNAAYAGGLLIAAYKSAPRTAEVEDEDDEDSGASYYKKVIPPDILELFRADPILTVLLDGETGEQAEENKPAARVEKTGADDDALEPVQSVEHLRNFTTTIEQAIRLARKHLGASTAKLPLLELHGHATEEENWKAERDSMKPRAWVLAKEFYGYPKGTRIFCADVLMYHMDLVRVDGKLKVLALYLDMD